MSVSGKRGLFVGVQCDECEDLSARAKAYDARAEDESSGCSDSVGGQQMRHERSKRGLEGRRHRFRLSSFHHFYGDVCQDCGEHPRGHPSVGETGHQYQIKGTA